MRGFDGNYINTQGDASAKLQLAYQIEQNRQQVRAQLEAKGRPIGGNDLWIAAHAVAEGLTLVTNNTKEFARIRELEVQNWTA